MVVGDRAGVGRSRTGGQAAWALAADGNGEALWEWRARGVPLQPITESKAALRSLATPSMATSTRRQVGMRGDPNG